MAETEDLNTIRLQVEIVLDEAAEAETSHWCASCKKSFRSKAAITLHNKAKHNMDFAISRDFQALDVIVGAWWKEVGGPQNMPLEAKRYFSATFERNPTGEELFAKFSKDGVALIPQVLGIDRHNALKLARLMFDKYISSEKRLQETAVQDCTTQISADDHNIIQYIGHRWFYNSAIAQKEQAVKRVRSIR